MADWPGDLPNSNANFTEVIHRPCIRSTSDSGHIVARPKWSATKREFKLLFKGISRSQMEQIVTWFEALGWGGTDFGYTNPIDDNYYTVRLLEDKVEFKYIADDIYSVKLNFMEV